MSFPVPAAALPALSPAGVSSRAQSLASKALSRNFWAEVAGFVATVSRPIPIR